MDEKKKLHEMTLEELWHLFPIRLVEHQEEWKEWYLDEEKRLLALLPENGVRINHIGSTAIRGMIAKPIVDILVELPLNCALEEAKDTLEKNGYLVMSEEKNRISLNLGYTEEGFAQRVYHVHLRHTGDNDELYFRDYLIEHPLLAKEYEKMKGVLWRQYEFDRDAYTEAKTKFIAENTAKAKEIYKNRYL